MNLLAAADSADSYGWDTVFAVHIADANAAIVRAGTSPPAFQGTDAPDGYSVAGTFGPWAIAPGGSGDLVRLAIPLHDVVIIEPGGAKEPAAGTALVDVRLLFLDEDEDSRTVKLKVRSASSEDREKPASVVSIEYSGAAPGFLGDAALQALLEQWLDANLADFDHVFATVDIDRTADTAAFEWMQPTHVSYAYSDFGASDGALAVLCMTENRTAAELVQQVSGTAIPEGQRSGFLVSRERLLANLLLPSMPNVFPGSKVSDYTLSATGQSIVLASTDVAFTATTPARGDTPAQTHQASVINLQLTIEAAEMQMDVTTATELSPGVRAYCQTQSFLGVRLVVKPDGTQTLGFFDSRPAISNHWTEADQGIEITEEILGIAALLLTVVATVVTGGAAIGIAALIVGLVVGVMSVTATSIEDAGKDNAPTIGAMVLDSTAAIVWPDSKDFTLTSACLSSSLQMSGSLAGG